MLSSDGKSTFDPRETTLQTHTEVGGREARQRLPERYGVFNRREIWPFLDGPVELPSAPGVYMELGQFESRGQLCCLSCECL